jgi:hypothetical protein
LIGDTAAMKRHWMLRATLLAAVICLRASAHPSSGIVVDEKGDVYFVHSGTGVAKIERDGKLTYVKRSTGGHWLCLDAEGSFARTQPKFFERITPDGAKPAILFADGGAPIAVCRDGNLYYASNWRGGTEHPPGGLTVTRQTPEGKLSGLSTNLTSALSDLQEGVTGLAAAPDGALYVTSPSSIWRVTMNGSITRFTGHVNDCDGDLPPNWRPPGFRGVTVATNGVVFAAATGCRCAVTMTNGVFKTIFKSERPWSPTDVAWQADNLFVLEWTHPNGGAEDGWRPRVRKLASDGVITTLAEVKENLIVR